HILDAQRTVAVGHDASLAVGPCMLAHESDGGVLAFERHADAQIADDDLGPGMNRERRKRLAAVVSVPDDHFVGSACVESTYCCVNLPGEELPHLLVFGIGLVLATDTGHALGVGDQKNGLARLSRK